MKDPEAEVSPDTRFDAVATVERSIHRWPDTLESEQKDMIAEEVPVALVYNGVSHAVMMASPIDLEAFALGFSLTEGIINQIEDIYGIEIVRRDAGIELEVTISGACFARLKSLRRNLTGRTGCGICGAESLDQIKQQLEPLQAGFNITHDAIDVATRNLAQHQPIQALSGAVHGAAWCDTEGKVQQVCEDVGRHNALDKLVGRLWPEGHLKSPGFLLMSSRASYEILVKAAKSGIAVVVAVSAPTSMAIDIANEAGITLVGFSREGRHVVYANCQRLSDSSR